MHRRNPPADERLRAMARQISQTGETVLAEELAEILVQRGLLPEPPHVYSEYSSIDPGDLRGVYPSVSAVLPATKLSPAGPGLCMIPINRSIAHVKIAPRGGTEARASHRYFEEVPQGSGNRPWPGLPARRSRSTWTGRGQVFEQGYRVTHAPCEGDFPPWFSQVSPTAKKWPATGWATVYYDRETGDVRILDLTITFVGKSPPNYEDRRRRLRANVMSRLPGFLRHWIPQHLDLFDRADVGVTSTQVANLLGRVRMRREAAAKAAEALEEERSVLREQLLELMGREGLL